MGLCKLRAAQSTINTYPQNKENHMHSLKQELVQLCQNSGCHPDRQTEKLKSLGEIVQDLDALNIAPDHAHDLNTSNIHALINHWQNNHLPIVTIKSRLSELYWWADMVGKGWIFPAEYKDYTPDLPRMLTNSAWSLSNFDRLPDRRFEYVLLLMEGFGLQFNEAFNLKTRQAFKKTKLVVSHWWKFGEDVREVPVISKWQVELLHKIIRFTGNNPLKPDHLSNSEFLYQLKQTMKQAGMRDLQGLRYRYAQRRYFEITGQYCPLAGGTPTEFLRPDFREIDRAARSRISKELGLSSAERIETFLG